MSDIESDTAVCRAEAAAPPVPRPRYGVRAALMMTASGWSANQFSALLGTYRAAAGLSASAVTALLAVYVLGLIPGLLCGAPLADRLGRRPVALAALAANLAATLLLVLGAFSPVWLWPGRALTGLGAGALLSAGGAWVKELSSPPYAPVGERARGTAARRAGVFVSLGFATGGLAASLIAQWAPYPTVWAYLPHVLLAAAAGALAWGCPETRPRAGAAVAAPARASGGAAPGASSASAPRRGPGFGRTVLLMAPWVFAAPTIGFATLPGLLGGALPGWETVYAGVATAVVPGAGVAVQPVARRLAARSLAGTALAGLGTVAAGLVLAAVAAASGLPSLGLAAGAVLGAGYGLTLAYGLTRTAALASPLRLARLTSYFWSAAYLGMFAPLLLTWASALLPVPVLLLAAAGAALLTGLPVAGRRAGR
ncbi:MFS transporter [Nocardiopsis potens]|uniref:MFS transporter n=1 Tax=Nocardiopsis potens TaxID=1246458 RepID=UPI00037883FB|nr:MFS transporter [Nocardiopsis potens]